MKNQDELLKILREVEKNPNISQRELAANVNFSLGKLNYCLNALKIKGLVKMKNFHNNKLTIMRCYPGSHSGVCVTSLSNISFLSVLFSSNSSNGGSILSSCK